MSQQYKKITKVKYVPRPVDVRTINSDVGPSFESIPIKSRPHIRAILYPGTEPVSHFYASSEPIENQSITNLQYLKFSPYSSMLNRDFENRNIKTQLDSRKTNSNSFTVKRRTGPLQNDVTINKRYDNNFVSYAIPSSIYGVRWIHEHTEALLEDLSDPNSILRPQGEVYDYKRFNGIPLTYPTKTTVYSVSTQTNVDVDFVGMNTVFYEPISLLKMNTGLKSLSSLKVTPENYSAYLSNKKYVPFRTRGMSFFRKDQDRIVRNLNKMNLSSFTLKAPTTSETKVFRTSPITRNSKVHLIDSGGNRHVLNISTDMENEAFSSNFYQYEAKKRELRNSFTNTLLNIASQSGENPISIETREILFPKRENTHLSFSRQRSNLFSRKYDAYRKNSEIHSYWSTEPTLRARTHFTSNSLDYKNTPYYNEYYNVVDSTFALDNTVLSNGKRLVGELSYQNDEFYSNLILRTNKSFSAPEKTGENFSNQLTSRESLDFQLENNRPYELLSAEENLAKSLRFGENYFWGTSLNPVDLRENFKYYTCSSYDSDKIKIDFRDNPTQLVNISATLNSYVLNKEVLSYFGVKNADATGYDENESFSRYTEADEVYSTENPGVSLDRALSEKVSLFPENKAEEMHFKKTSRPTMQLNYFPNKYNTEEAGFIYDEEVDNPPFYENYDNILSTTSISQDFNSIISEYNSSRNYDKYNSKPGSSASHVRSFLSLPGSGESSDRYLSDDSAASSVRVRKIFSLFGTGLKKIDSYPMSSNNYAWFSTYNKSGKRIENVEYRGKNPAHIPSDSTYVLENSLLTPYEIRETTGYSYTNSTGDTIWSSISPQVRKNAAGTFNIEDGRNDYIEITINKFSDLNNNLNLIDDNDNQFTISMWFQPNEEWSRKEDSIGLLTLKNSLDKFSSYVSVYAKDHDNKLKVEISTSNINVIQTSLEYSPGNLNHFVLSYDSGTITIHLNGGSNTPGGSSETIVVSLSEIQQIRLINKIILGISKNAKDIAKYRGVLDEFYLFKKAIQPTDLNTLYAGGKPSNVIEMWANNELPSGFIPVIYNRIGYPYYEELEYESETHDMKFMNRYVITDKISHPSLQIQNIEDYSLIANSKKKLVPYNGLYPYQRIMQIGDLYVKNWKLGCLLEGEKDLGYSQKIQSLLQPTFAPGVFFNSIKSGIECPWPLYTNMTGIEPTVPYQKEKIFNQKTNTYEHVYLDALAPSWYYLDNFKVSEREFLPTYPKTPEDVLLTRSYQELVKSQPTYLNKFNYQAGLVINREPTSKLSMTSIMNESFLESMAKEEQTKVVRVREYEYCILEFTPGDIESGSGFSLEIPGEENSLNIAFIKSEAISSVNNIYSLKMSNPSDVQIEIEASKFNTRNIQNSICNLFNIELDKGPYRAVVLDRTNEEISKPEDYVLEKLNLDFIDRGLDVSSDETVRIAFVYVGKDTNGTISNRTFLNFDEAKVSVYAGPSSDSLGILYRNQKNEIERNIDLSILPIGQYGNPLYRGIEREVSITTGQELNRLGAIKKPEQVFLLASDHYKTSPEEIKESYVWPSFTWKRTRDDRRIKNAIKNFKNEIESFFLKNGQPLSYSSTLSKMKTEPGKSYSMEIFMDKTDDFCTIKTDGKNSGKYFGCPYRYMRADFYKNDKDITSDFAYAPFTPAYHYGETVTKLTFTATKDMTDIQEIVNNIEIKHYNPGMEKKFIEAGYNGRTLTRDHEVFLSFINSPSYIAKNNLDSCVNLTKVVNGTWKISLMSEFPILNYNHHLSEKDTPKGFLYNNGVLPGENEGVFFGIRESALGIRSSEGSLIELCGFRDDQQGRLVEETSHNKVGEFAPEKTVHEAIIAIPYVEQPYTKIIEPYMLTEKFISLKEKEEEKPIYFFSAKSDTSSLDNLKEKLSRYEIPPDLDFVNNENILPFICYVVEEEMVLSDSDLANIWQGRLPSVSREGYKDSTKISTHPSEFFSHRKMPEDTKFMVFKLKQKQSSRNHTEQRVSYNWPYDYFSIIEAASLEMGVSATNRSTEEGEPR